MKATEPLATSPDGRPDCATHHVGADLERVRAWSRLDGTLRAIAADLLVGPAEREPLLADAVKWLDATTDAAVIAVCSASLGALVRTLDSLLADVPPDVARRLSEARARHDAGVY